MYVCLECDLDLNSHVLQIRKVYVIDKIIKVLQFSECYIAFGKIIHKQYLHIMKCFFFQYRINTNHLFVYQRLQSQRSVKSIFSVMFTSNIIITDLLDIHLKIRL